MDQTQSVLGAGLSSFSEWGKGWNDRVSGPNSTYHRPTVKEDSFILEVQSRITNPGFWDANGLKSSHSQFQIRIDVQIRVHFGPCVFHSMNLTTPQIISAESLSFFYLRKRPVFFNPTPSFFDEKGGSRPD